MQFISRLKNSKNAFVGLIIIGSSLIVFITLGLNHSNGLYLIPITATLSSGREVFSLASALGILFSGLGAPIFGGLSDKYGPGKTIFLLGVFQIFSWLWFSSINSEFDLFGSKILMGIGASAILGIALSTTGKSVSSQNRSIFVGFIMASGSLGQFIIVPIMGFIIENYSWSLSALISSLVGLIILVSSYLISLTSHNENNDKSEDQSIMEALNEAISNNSYKLLTAGFFVCGFHVTFVATHLPAFLSDQSISSSTAGISLSLIGLFNIFGTISFGYFGSRFSKKNLLSILYALRSLLFLIFIVSPKTNLSVLIFASILGILWLSTVPLTNGIISDLFGNKFTSMIFGITLMSHHLGSFLGSWVGGRMYDINGNYDLVWWICVGLGFTSSIIHLPIKNIHKNQLQLE
jgi:MFS family permease